MKSFIAILLVTVLFMSCSQQKSEKSEVETFEKTYFFLPDSLKYWPDQDSLLSRDQIQDILNDLQDSDSAALITRTMIYESIYPLSKPYLDTLKIVNTTSGAQGEILRINGIEGFLDVDKKWEQSIIFMGDELSILYKATLPPPAKEIKLNVTLGDSTKTVVFKYENVNTKWNRKSLKLTSFGIDSVLLYNQTSQFARAN